MAGSLFGFGGFWKRLHLYERERKSLLPRGFLGVRSGRIGDVGFYPGTETHGGEEELRAQKLNPPVQLPYALSGKVLARAARLYNCSVSRDHEVPTTKSNRKEGTHSTFCLSQFKTEIF